MSLHKHGGNIYDYANCLDFSTNLNPLGPPASVRQAVSDSLIHLTDYPQVGYEPLRSAIGHYEEVPAGQVICGNGAAELIYTLCQARMPKRALLAVPSFAEYAQALAGVGCAVEQFYLQASEGLALTGRFLDAFTEDLDIVFLCNPNNPTGLLIEPDLLQRILEKCEKLKILLVVDECFLDFVKEPEKHTLKEELEEHPHLFLLKAFTKRYAMPGVRLGYGLCADQALLDEMRTKVQPWNISCMAMAAGLAALQEKAHVEEGRQIVFKERFFLQEALSELGLPLFPTDANYIFFQGPENLFAECVKRGILIRDCSNYDGLETGYFRIAVKTHAENIRLIEVLREILG